MIERTPIISVIVPVFNVKPWLERTIESLTSQTIDSNKIEIILVDDGSTDGSENICDKYKNDCRFKIIHKKNGGLSSARNEGIKLANGEYISFVDSDDYVDTNFYKFFEEQALPFKSDVYSCDYTQISENKIKHYRKKVVKPFKQYSSKQFIMISIKKKCLYAPSWSYIFKKSFLDNNNLFFLEGITHEDMEFLPRFLLKADKVLYIRAPFYHYEIRNGSITQTSNINKYYDSMFIFQNWKKMFSNVEDKKLKKYLFGFLSRCYINVSRIYRRKDNTLSYIFLFVHALSLLDLLKTSYLLFITKTKC